jgi:hypothetical protein
MLSNEQRLSARNGPEPVPAEASISHRAAKPTRRGLVVAAAVMGVAVFGAIPAVGLAPARLLGSSVVTAPSQAQPQGLLAEATHEYNTMTATRYQAALRVDLSKGTYFYDCVGFVTYALGQAAPQARTTIMTKFNIAPNRIPSPARYVTLFGQLDGTQPGWQPVHQVVDLQPGDVVAWTYTNPHGATGHAFVVGSVPKAVGTGQYEITVWDSTATPHGSHDTRLTNPRNLPGGNGKPSGLGSGQVVLDTGAGGSLTRVHWSPTGSAVGSADYGMGRPTS